MNIRKVLIFLAAVGLGFSVTINYYFFLKIDIFIRYPFVAVSLFCIGIFLLVCAVYRCFGRHLKIFKLSKLSLLLLIVSLCYMLTVNFVFYPKTDWEGRLYSKDGIFLEANDRKKWTIELTEKEFYEKSQIRQHKTSSLLIFIYCMSLVGISTPMTSKKHVLTFPTSS